MNPVELSREDIERILALAERAPEGKVTVNISDAQFGGWIIELIETCSPNRLKALCQAALNYVALRDGSRIVCTLDGVRISGPALDEEVGK